MSCPRTETGQALCHIVDHPDHLSQSFCSTCNLRFQKDPSLHFGFGLGQFPLFFVFAIVMVLLTSMSRNDLKYEGSSPNNAAPVFVAPPIAQAVDVMPDDHHTRAIG
jgi:hypothetical protein